MLLVLFFILLSFALWKFLSVRQKATEAIILGNMDRVSMALEEFATETGGIYPLNFDIRADQIKEGARAVSLGSLLEDNPVVNPLGGTPLSLLSPDTALPQKAEPGVVIWVPTEPLDSIPGARGYKLGAYGPKGRLLATKSSAQ